MLHEYPLSDEKFQTLAKGFATIAKVAPFHSKLQSDKPVYHDNDNCTEGNNIERKNKVPGTGGRPRCDHCTRLA